MAAFFVSDSKLATRVAPLWTMRSNAPATGAKLGEQMCELVPEGALNLGRAMVVQARIEYDEVGTRFGAASRTAQSGIPFHCDGRGNSLRA